MNPPVSQASFLTDERGHARFTRGQMAAIGFSLAVHLTIGAVVAYQKFGSQFREVPPPPAIFVDIPRNPPPSKPAPAPATPSKPVIQTHVPVKLPIKPIDTLPFEPVPGDVNLQKVGPPTFAFSTGAANGTGTGPSSAGTGPSVIGNPDWIKKPGARQFQRAYPERALRRGIAGAATLDCRVAADGTVNSCRVVDESPVGENFGSAAMKLSRPQSPNHG